MVVIIAHINGPSGAGKTTLGKIINEKYPYIKNIDIDDILINDLPTIFPKSYKKYFNKNQIEVFRKKFIYKGIQKVIKIYKYVILVGNFKIEDMTKNIFYNIENVNTDNKFVIDIDNDVLLERRIKRHFKFLYEKSDFYYKKLLKKGHMEIDLNVWNERMYWGNSRDVFYEKSKKEGYILLSQEEIIKNIEDIINNGVI